MKKRKNNSYIPNRLSYILIIIGILIALGIGVYAYGTSNPAAFGHTMSEVAPPSGCGAGQVLQWSGGAWGCTTLSAPLTRGAQVFRINSYCSGAGTLTDSGSCSSALCRYDPGVPSGYCCGGYLGNGKCSSWCNPTGPTSTYYTCGGSCSAGSPRPCSNTPLGYLVN